LDPEHAAAARSRSRASLVHQADFFLWAARTHERFDACVGNPPFIRYHDFAGETRERALKLTSQFGVRFSQLTSSWAPFLAASAFLLKAGGRMAFVVPAEIGHATYALPLLTALMDNFEKVHVIAIKEKLFPRLSEDAWFLYAEDFGGCTDHILLSVEERFQPWEEPPREATKVARNKLYKANGRLRRWILPRRVRQLYDELGESSGTYRIGSVADIGIGYVTGGNEFFHLKPSVADRLGVPPAFLKAAVRKGEFLPPSSSLTTRHVEEWIRRDEPVLLLHLKGDERLPEGVRRYLQSEAAAVVKGSYKCSKRNPWYAVPGVIVPDGFLTYMSGNSAALVRNAAQCVATNSVHTVVLKGSILFKRLQQGWATGLSELSREIEGHPLGGGLLKLEPGEARRVLLPSLGLRIDARMQRDILEGVSIMRSWRHCA
jgi:adenine-specific DNA-methyltransferase